MLKKITGKPKDLTQILETTDDNQNLYLTLDSRAPIREGCATVTH